MLTPVVAGLPSSVESRLSPAAISDTRATTAAERLAVNEATAAEQIAARDPGCFTAGTRIRTEHGDKPIEKVKAGEKVLSADPKTGKQSYQRVEKTYVRQVSELFIVMLQDGRRIETTAEHPFWVEGRGFVAAKKLARSDLLRDRRGHRVAVASVAYRRGRFTVYNFAVPLTHTYYAGGVWVHNPRECGQALRQIGQTGERTAGIVKNDRHIPSFTGKRTYRVPDELDEHVIGEVKNVKYQHGCDYVVR